MLLNMSFLHAADTDIISARQMVNRLLPTHAKSFIFKKITSNKDIFIIENKDKQIQISGNNANSIAVGLNFYLKNYCLTTISWFRTDPIQLPETLPLVKKPVKITAKVPLRFFLNYCTFGYSMPWWTWKDWERLIDWMALNGINTPLAITGQEAIWYNVWKKFGLTDSEIRAYFTGPAHLPWHRMSNIDGWQGPLPISWLDNQKELQQKIVQRERELNMRPVLPAFAGHIPSGLKRRYPHLLTTNVSQWCDFSDQYQCTFLNPMDSLYSIIQKEYLKEQTKIYGTNHIYGIDCFNEVQPPSWNTDSLALISSHIYKSLKSADKDAIWLQMGWLFYNDASHWTTDRIKSYLQGVPQNKLLLLDYFCENTEIWQRTESFFGQPFIWCYLGNFGGNTMICSPLQKIDQLLTNTLKKAKQNFQGIGATLEGLDVNQFAYEFVFDRAWNIPFTRKAWINNLADRRLGKYNTIARQAWQLMYHHVLTASSFSPQGTLIESFPTLQNSKYELQNTYMNSSQQRSLIKTWQMLLSVKKYNRYTYKFDIINIGRQVLGNYFHQLRDSFTIAYQTNNSTKLKIFGHKMKLILADVDALVACDRTFSLKQWIDDARAIGINANEKDYYEKNARTLITVWGDKDVLTDYARRGWAGLISNYYAPRWNMFIDEVIKCNSQSIQFNEKDFSIRCHKWGRKFIEPSTIISYPQEQNGIILAKKLFIKYFKH